MSYKRYPLENPIEDVSQTSKWESPVMKIVDLIEPIDKKTNALDIKAATKIVKSVYDDALTDAVAVVEKTNVCKFLKCSNIESNNKCFLENNPEFFAACEKIGHFEDAIKAAIAAIEKLKEEK